MPSKTIITKNGNTGKYNPVSMEVDVLTPSGEYLTVEDARECFVEVYAVMTAEIKKPKTIAIAAEKLETSREAVYERWERSTNDENGIY